MDDARQTVSRLYKNIARVIFGKKEVVVLAMATCICRGHLLIEDVPGTGKTMLARALAISLGARFTRIQCTPDMLPTDVTGVSIYNQRTGDFEFKPGPVFTNVLLADEINRTTPRTQSSLLECMAEGQVTVEGESRALHDPFMVVATQNPVEFAGTYPLPEAQLDRFFMRIRIGYPSAEDEMAIVAAQNDHHPMEDLTSVITPDELLALQDAVKRVEVHDDVRRYITEIVRATRQHEQVELGASPRGSLALTRAAQAMALIAGREYVEPQMVKRAVIPVLAHRLIMKTRGAGSIARSSEHALREVLEQVKVPVAA